MPADPTHPLVTVGDSLTHGLTSGAVFHTSLSWPAQVAAALGIEHFAVPRYGGPLDGLPLNIESLVRRLAAEVRRRHQHLRADAHAADAAPHPRRQRGLLGAWAGLRPAADRRALRQRRDLRLGRPRRPVVHRRAGAARASGGRNDDLFGVKPARDNDIAALSVLAPFGVDATQVTAARWHGDNGGIGTLVVALGANNALDAIVSKDVMWSAAGFDD